MCAVMVFGKMRVVNIFGQRWQNILPALPKYRQMRETASSRFVKHFCLGMIFTKFLDLILKIFELEKCFHFEVVRGCAGTMGKT